MLYLEQGPSSLVISARKAGKEHDLDCEQIVRLLTRLQKEVKEALPLLRLKAAKVVNTRHIPWVARRMIDAATTIAGEELSAMSAVAGSIADCIKEELAMQGFDIVLVNNGGDIAAYTCLDRTVAVHLGGAGGIGRIIRLKGPFDVGIATSGQGGRSLTKGVADYVTVLGKSGGLADAAATYLGNAACVSSRNIRTISAELLDPETDLAGEIVTLDTHELMPDEAQEALDKGLSKALELKGRGAIEEAFISVKGIFGSTLDGFSKLIVEDVYEDQKDSYSG